jgi:hypothetical protein
VVGFITGGVETSGSATAMLVRWILGREICCEDGRWLELAKNLVH